MGASDCRGTAFPAYAGMNRVNLVSNTLYKCVPRLCGDEPVDLTPTAADVLRSPLMRG